MSVNIFRKQSLLGRKMKQSKGERDGDRGDLLNRVAGEGLSEKVTFEQRLEEVKE